MGGGGIRNFFMPSTKNNPTITLGISGIKDIAARRSTFSILWPIRRSFETQSWTKQVKYLISEMP